MSEYTGPVGDVRTRLSCDAYGCLKVIEAEAPNEWGPHGSRELVKGQALAAGWSAWASRSTRHYCGTHSPRPGHKMRRLW